MHAAVNRLYHSPPISTVYFSTILSNTEPSPWLNRLTRALSSVMLFAADSAGNFASVWVMVYILDCREGKKITKNLKKSNNLVIKRKK